MGMELVYSTKLIKTRHIVSCISVLEGTKRVIDLLVDIGDDSSGEGYVECANTL